MQTVICRHKQNRKTVRKSRCWRRTTLVSQVLSHKVRAVQWRFGGEGSHFESKSGDWLNICFYLISYAVKLHVVSKLKTLVSEEKKKVQGDGWENTENLGKFLRCGFVDNLSMDPQSPPDGNLQALCLFHIPCKLAAVGRICWAMLNFQESMSCSTPWFFC